MNTIKEDNNILENIYMTDKNVSKCFALNETSRYKDYLIGNETIVRLPKDKDLKRYYIIAPQTVDSEEESLEIIEVNQNMAKISFLINKDNYYHLLITASFDSLSKSWDVRKIHGKNRIPTNIEEALSEIESMNPFGEDGIIYSETFRKMMSDSNKLQENSLNKMI